jgi:hypothetical protein
MTRNGKIAHLPAELKDELNQRLEHGDESEPILDWLNSFYDTKELVKADYHGVPISKQNLSEWRNGGFLEWQLRREFIGHALTLRQSDNDLCGHFLETESLAGALARKLVTHYAAILNTWDGEPDPNLEAKLRILRPLVRDVALLQKTVHLAGDRERIVNQRGKEDAKRNKDAMVRRFEMAPLARMYYQEALTRMDGTADSKSYANRLANAKYDIQGLHFNETESQPPPVPDNEDDAPATPAQDPATPQTPSNVIELGQTQSNPVKPLKLPGRNDPCLCGSNKKFKKCCLLKLTQHPASQTQSNPVKPLAANK